MLLKIIKGCDWLGAGGDVTAPLPNCSCASCSCMGLNSGAVWGGLAAGGGGGFDGDGDGDGGEVSHL